MGKKIVIAITSIIISCFVGEAFLRIAGFSYPKFYIADEYRGGSLLPKAEGWWRNEGVVYIRINSQGLRDREHIREKPEKTVRIAVLGDSYAEAFQVQQEQAFWSVLERELGKCVAQSGKRIEVINFGVSGYGTAQELITLQRHVFDYKPDIVLLAFTTGNDIRNNSKVLEPEKLQPFYVFKNDKLLLDDSFKNRVAFSLRRSLLGKIYYNIINRSRLAQLVYQGKLIIQSRRLEKNQMPMQRYENFLDEMIYKEPREDVWAEAWKITENLLSMIQKEVKDHNSMLFVVTLSNGIQVHPDNAVRLEFMERIKVDDLFYPDTRIKKYCEGKGILVLNLAPQLLSYAQKYNVYLHGFKKTILGFGHWNSTGHRLAGEIIAKNLCDIVNR